MNQVNPLSTDLDPSPMISPMKFRAEWSFGIQKRRKGEGKGGRKRKGKERRRAKGRGEAERERSEERGELD